MGGPTKHYEYYPLKTFPEGEGPSGESSDRRRKSCSLYVVIFLILVSYIVVNILLPENGAWFLFRGGEEEEYEETGVYQEEPFGRRSQFDQTKSKIAGATERHRGMTTDETTRETTVTTEGTVRATGSKSGSFEEKLACVVPRLNPYDKTIKHLIKAPDPVNCPEKFPLLFESYANSTVAALPERIKEAGYESCCYGVITRRNNSDGGFLRPGNCTQLEVDSPEARHLPAEMEYVGMYCKPKRNVSEEGNATSTTTEPPVKHKVVDVHVLVPLKEEVERRVRNFYGREVQHQNGSAAGGSSKAGSRTPESEKVNVVLLGIDAVSHMNFIRTMPTAYAYLMNNLSAVEMQGYNKVGDNTFPNLAAVLTSWNTSQMQTCEKEEAFDACPFIWKRFAAQGYRTSYGEDSTWMGIFNYLKSGFHQPPTDYYLRPFGNAAEDLIGTNKRLNARLCYGPRLSFQVLLGYMKKLAFAMGHHKRYFQLIWATSLTHDFLNSGRAGDAYLLEMLHWFHTEGHFNQTVFILMSDHGIRWGSILDYKQGQLEERLPFLYFVLPSWFKVKYPVAVANLAANVPRLTTPFDLHETLQDLLNLHNLNSDTLQKRAVTLNELTAQHKMPRGISHFLTVPPSRTCKTASVADHYCTCHQSKEVSGDHPVVQQVANYVVYHINVLISNYTKCAYLTLGTVKRATMLGTDLAKAKAYQLLLETRPGGAIFETSVEKDTKDFWQVSGTISRTNLYGNQSHCVDDKEVKMYCYCLDLITNKTARK